ncbi:hypothetical protein [Phyllobacterium myrsinacearum]|uniref:Transmembrane protein n=1 Tax=Phyllobacterium myrsinacearum TaxID=28101 RepID=A0A839EVH8_9HYPH|nr:hypothetical protein [Phyllobacterium myrsinacearum]MBA8880427.1 hypothetical protein [Phyllobacterium myrsinacearum]
MRSQHIAHTRRSAGWLLALAACLYVLSTTSGWAHRSSTGTDTSGISIPSLSHGEMAIIASYRKPILDLAARMTRTDETFRRLVNYTNIQYSYCLWGIVPGSISDEQSPFNECSHAYLAAAKATLVYMRDMPDNKEAVGALISDLDADLVRNGGSFVMCQYSGDPYNTADIIKPRWGDVPGHLTSLFSFLGFAMALVSAGFAFMYLTRTPRQPVNA